MFQIQLVNSNSSQTFSIENTKKEGNGLIVTKVSTKANLANVERFLPNILGNMRADGNFLSVLHSRIDQIKNQKNSWLMNIILFFWDPFRQSRLKEEASTWEILASDIHVFVQNNLKNNDLSSSNLQATAIVMDEDEQTLSFEPQLQFVPRTKTKNFSLYQPVDNALNGKSIQVMTVQTDANLAAVKTCWKNLVANSKNPPSLLSALKERIQQLDKASKGFLNGIYLFFDRYTTWAMQQEKATLETLIRDIETTTLKHLVALKAAENNTTTARKVDATSASIISVTPTTSTSARQGDTHTPKLTPPSKATASSISTRQTIRNSSPSPFPSSSVSSSESPSSSVSADDSSSTINDNNIPVPPPAIEGNIPLAPPMDDGIPAAPPMDGIPSAPPMTGSTVSAVITPTFYPYEPVPPAGIDPLKLKNVIKTLDPATIKDIESYFEALGKYTTAIKDAIALHKQNLDKLKAQSSDEEIELRKAESQLEKFKSKINRFNVNLATGRITISKRGLLPGMAPSNSYYYSDTAWDEFQTDIDKYKLSKLPGDDLRTVNILPELKKRQTAMEEEISQLRSDMQKTTKRIANHSKIRFTIHQESKNFKIQFHSKTKNGAPNQAAISNSLSITELDSLLIDVEKKQRNVNSAINDWKKSHRTTTESQPIDEARLKIMDEHRIALSKLTQMRMGSVRGTGVMNRLVSDIEMGEIVED